jgi:hypothetical protein
MRGLTIQQPYATLCALGEKELETRSWRTNYRGLVALHSSADFPPWCRKLLNVEPFYSALIRDRKRVPMPLGKILAIGLLVDCHPVTEDFCRNISRTEYAFGVYQTGRFAFRLENVHMLRHPIDWKGMLGFWHVPADLEARIVREAA